MITEAFRRTGLTPPRIALTTFSVHLRTHLLGDGDFVAALPRSVLQVNARQFGLKALPVKLPVRRFPIAVVTLKNRALTPVAQLFIERLRELTKPMRNSR